MHVDTSFSKSFRLSWSFEIRTISLHSFYKINPKRCSYFIFFKRIPDSQNIVTKSRQNNFKDPSRSFIGSFVSHANETNRSPDVGIQSVDEKFRTISRATHHTFPFHRVPRFWTVVHWNVEKNGFFILFFFLFFSLPANWIRSRDFQERWVSKEFAGCVNRWLRVCAIVLKKIGTWASQGVAVNVKRASSRARRGDRSWIGPSRSCQSF